MAKGNIKNSIMLIEAASFIAEYLDMEVCDMMHKQYDGATYCSPDCPRTADDGCVLHLLRMRCAEKQKSENSK